MRHKTRRKSQPESATLGERISRTLDFPADVFGNVPTVSLKGDTELLINGCESVCEYDDQKIVLCLCGKYLTVLGSALVILTFSGGRATINGKIHTLHVAEIPGEDK